MDPNAVSMQDLSSSSSSFLSTGSGSSCSSQMDNDISDLLRDNFGAGSCGGGRADALSQELDKNLSEILDDLQKAVKEEDITNNNFVDHVEKIDVENPSDFDHVGTIRGQGPALTLLDIQKEIEVELEKARVSSLRHPRFQTIPAYEKRAKQEAQWRAAINAARRAQSLGQSQMMGAVIGEGPLDSRIHIPPLVPKLETIPIAHSASKLDLTSLDLPPPDVVALDSDEAEIGQLKTSDTIVLVNQDRPVKTNLMINTKKHLSASNHFPANSRIFNRSLQELQSTAQAISSKYMAASVAVQAAAVSSQYGGRGAQWNRTKTSVKMQPLQAIQTYSPLTANIGPNANDDDDVIIVDDDDDYSPTFVSAPRASPPGNGQVNRPTLPSLPSTRQVFASQRAHRMDHPYHSSRPRSGHLPVRQAPAYSRCVQPSPATLHQQQRSPGGAVTPAPPVTLTHQQQRGPGGAVIPAPCANCRTLAQYLPFLGYSRLQLVGRHNPIQPPLPSLLCEACGATVRESAVSACGEQLRLDHGAAVTFPTFLTNSPVPPSHSAHSQNFIQLPESRLRV